mgnify:CR=1 FL=1
MALHDRIVGSYMHATYCTRIAARKFGHTFGLKEQLTAPDTVTCVNGDKLAF